MNEQKFDTVLAVDTSTNILRLALQFGGDRLVKWSGEVEKSHGQILLKKIGDLMESAGVNSADLDGFVVCIGPGSFTGLRIGLAAVKGMVMAVDRPVAAVTSFELAAARLAEIETAVAVVIPLNRDEGIVGVVDGGRCDRESVAVLRYDRLFDTIGSGAVAGLGLDLAERFPAMPNKDYTDRLDYDAADLLHLGREKLLAGRAADIARLEPLYLQKSQAEIRFEERRTES